MAADDRREGEVAVARGRLTEIAAELSRRAQPEYVKTMAKEAAREKADELKGRAREAARDKFEDIKETAMTGNKGMDVLGAAIGGAFGYAVVKLIADRRERVEYRGFGPYAGYREIGYGFEGGEERYQVGKIDELKSQASEKLGDIKDRASGAVESAKEKLTAQTAELKEKVPSMDEVKLKARTVVQDDPVVIGLGALAIGAIAGLLLPITDSERRTYSKVRVAAQAKLQEAGGVIQDKLQGMADKMDQAGDQVRGAADLVGDATGSHTNLENVGSGMSSDASFDPNTPSVH